MAVDVDAKFSQDDLAVWSRTHNFVQEFATVEHVTYMIQPEWDSRVAGIDTNSCYAPSRACGARSRRAETLTIRPSAGRLGRQLPWPPGGLVAMKMRCALRRSVRAHDHRRKQHQLKSMHRSVSKRIKKRPRIPRVTNVCLLSWDLYFISYR